MFYSAVLAGIITLILAAFLCTPVYQSNKGGYYVKDYLLRLICFPFFQFGKGWTVIFSFLSILLYTKVSTEISSPVLPYLLTISLVLMFKTAIRIPFPIGIAFALAFMFIPSIITKIILIILIGMVLIYKIYSNYSGAWRELLHMCYEDFIDTFYPVFPLIFLLFTCFV